MIAPDRPAAAQEIAAAFIQGKKIGIVGVDRRSAEYMSHAVRRHLVATGVEWAKGSTADRIRHATSGGEIRLYAADPRQLRGLVLDIVVIEDRLTRTDQIDHREIAILVHRNQGEILVLEEGAL